MLEAARKTVEACRRGRSELEADELRILAVTRLIEIVGEAAKNVSEETRTRSPEIPWRAIGGTRDRLIHGYFDVDMDQLWRIVSTDLPNLIRSLERLSPPGEGQAD
jgi:uncharacterized protein with HEPN domain